MSYFLKLSISWLLVFQCAQAFAELLPIEISNLRPTQSNVGMREVQRKADKIRPLSKKERHDYLQKEPIPVVIGPEKVLYPIDHHHLARAVQESGHNKAYAEVILDLSSLSETDFWNEMKERGYVYLKDAAGKDITPADLPLEIHRLGDDPYRSLAGAVRREGGYEKDKTPFAEFKWALVFRTRIDVGTTDNEFKEAIQKAIKLAQSPEAEGLPGHIRTCNFVF